MAEGRNQAELQGITLLGNQGTQYYSEYAPQVLESFDNKHPNRDYFVKFNCPEFTSLCPITGQPDFARIELVYIPNIKMIESKALKLYYFSFRNHGAFHEDVVNRIADDLFDVLKPKYLRIYGNFAPRGGIAIKPITERWQQELDEQTFSNIKHLVEVFDRKK